MTDAEFVPFERGPDESLRHLIPTMTVCSVGIKRAFPDAAIQIGSTNGAAGKQVTWGIFYPAASAGLTILVEDLERCMNDATELARLVHDKIEMTREVLLLTADANEKSLFE